MRALAQAGPGPDVSRPFVRPSPASGACPRRHNPRCSVVNRSLGGGLGGRTPRPPLGGKGWRGSRQPLPSPSSTGQGDAPAAPPGTTREDVVLLDVDGMHCAGCVSRVRKLLEDQPAVRGASVSLATETALARVRLATPSHSSTGSEADELEKSGGEALNGGGGALEALGASLAQVGFSLVCVSRFIVLSGPCAARNAGGVSFGGTCWDGPGALWVLRWVQGGPASSCVYGWPGGLASCLKASRSPALLPGPAPRPSLPCTMFKQNGVPLCQLPALWLLCHQPQPTNPITRS